LLNRDEHDAIVRRLYESALGEAAWAGMLEHLAGMFGVTGSLILVQDDKGDVLGLAAYPFSPELRAGYYSSEVGRGDPRHPYFLSVRPGTVYYDHALYNVEEMNRDPRCRAANDAVGTTYSLGAVAALPNGATGYVALLSTEKEGHATEAAIRSLRRLAPHIDHALSLGQIADRRAVTQAALLDALARRANGVILLDGKGTPGFINDAARAILADDDGLAFSRGEFITRRGPETRQLRELIGAVIARSGMRQGGEMLVTRPGGRRPYVVRVMPAPKMERFLTGAGIAAVIHLHDLAAVRVPSKRLLIAAFGFSEREADLAIELVRCAGLSAAAENAGMALNTARRHLQSIFRKSGTASQAEAVQLFSRLA
jgi:hypothetical protein